MRMLWLLATALALLVAAPAAHAADRAEIIADCNDDGDLDGNYTPSEIRDARNNIPTDIDQYSDCRDVLSRALGGSGTGAVGGGGGAGGGALGGGGGGAAAGRRTAHGRHARASRRRSSRPARAAPTPRAGRHGADRARRERLRRRRRAQRDAPRARRLLILLALAAAAAVVPSVRRRVLARRLA